MTNTVSLGYQYFPDPAKGRPVFKGSIFVGNPDTDPELESNQKQVTVTQEDGTKVLVSQPLVTSDGGIPQFANANVVMSVEGNYSLKVLNKGGSQVYYLPNAFDGEPVTEEELNTAIDAKTYLRYSTIASLSADTDLTVGSYVITSGYITDGDGGGNIYRIDPAGTGTADGFSVIDLVNHQATALFYANEYNVRQAGATGDGVTDDTAAINTVFAYIRNINNVSGDEVPVSIIFPAGVYSVSSINASQIRGKGWSIHCTGAEILGAGAGLAVFDMLHSRGCTVYNLFVRGNNVDSPAMGVQIGYMVSGVSASGINFVGCWSAGFFTKTAYYNGGSEESLTSVCQWRNESGNNSAYCIIHDSSNIWHRQSLYAQGDLIAKFVEGVTQSNPAVVTSPGHGFVNGDFVSFREVGGMTELNLNRYTVANASVNTFELSGVDSTLFTAYTSGGTVALNEGYSFTQVTHQIASIFKPNGGPAVWIGWGSDRHRFENSYAFGTINPVVIYTDVVASLGVVHQSLYLDLLLEGNPSTGIFFERNSAGDINLGDFTFRSTGSKVTGQMFLANTLSGEITFIGSDINIPSFGGVTPTNGLFNPPSEFNFVGRIATRDGNGFGGMPGKTKGTTQNFDAQDSAYGVGSYSIESLQLNNVDVNYSMFKGEQRFTGDASSTIADNTLNAEPYTSVSASGIIFNGGSGIYFGTGSPEFVVTAEPGSIYLNLAGGANVSTFNKESGSGATGWVGK